MKKDRPKSPGRARDQSHGSGARAHAPSPRRLRVSALDPENPTPFRFEPSAAERGEIAARLGLEKLKKLRFQGSIEAEGAEDWRLDAMLGATVVQPCVVSLEPVTTRIDAPVTRRYLRKLADREAEIAASGTGEEGIEIPEDDAAEPLGREMDLWEVMIESLALALPDYPRSPGAALEKGEYAPPGSAPQAREEPRENPFAGLAALRRKLGDEGSGGEGNSSGQAGGDG